MALAAESEDDLHDLTYMFDAESKKFGLKINNHIQNKGRADPGNRYKR